MGFTDFTTRTKLNIILDGIMSNKKKKNTTKNNIK